MSRTFIATILAAAIAVTGFSAAPARAADGEDIAKALAGIAAIAIIGKAIKDSRDKDDDDKRVSRDRHHDNDRWDRGRHDRDDRWNRDRRRGHDRDRDRGHRRDARALPGACFQRFDTNRGTVRAFGRYCLSRNYRHARSLPNHCEMNVRTRRGTVRAYEPSCLRRQGYSIARG